MGIFFNKRKSEVRKPKDCGGSEYCEDFMRKTSSRRQNCSEYRQPNLCEPYLSGRTPNKWVNVGPRDGYSQANWQNNTYGQSISMSQLNTVVPLIQDPIADHAREVSLVRNGYLPRKGTLLSSQSDSRDGVGAGLDGRHPSRLIAGFRHLDPLAYPNHESFKRALEENVKNCTSAHDPMDLYRLLVATYPLVKWTPPGRGSELPACSFASPSCYPLSNSSRLRTEYFTLDEKYHEKQNSHSAEQSLFECIYSTKWQPKLESEPEPELGDYGYYASAPPWFRQPNFQTSRIPNSGRSHFPVVEAAATTGPGGIGDMARTYVRSMVSRPEKQRNDVVRRKEGDNVESHVAVSEVEDTVGGGGIGDMSRTFVPGMVTKNEKKKVDKARRKRDEQERRVNR